MTKKERDEVLKSLIVISDTREQKNGHIIKFLKDTFVPIIERKLDYGDYSCIIPVCEYMTKEIDFSRKITIERKANLTELSGNLSNGRLRFEREFERAQSDGARMFLLIESGSYKDILTHKYDTDMNPNAFIASLLTFQHRFNLNISFIDKIYSARYLYRILYYFVFNYLNST